MALNDMKLKLLFISKSKSFLCLEWGSMFCQRFIFYNCTKKCFAEVQEILEGSNDITTRGRGIIFFRSTSTNSHSALYLT